MGCDIHPAIEYRESADRQMSVPYIPFAEVPIGASFTGSDGFTYSKWSDDAALVEDSEHPEDIGTLLHFPPRFDVVQFEA